MRVLKSRLAEHEEERREAELAKERGVVMDTGFGSQIRSYVLHPYQLVKDHRTDVEEGNAQGVLDGKLSTGLSRRTCSRRRQERSARRRSPPEVPLDSLTGNSRPVTALPRGPGP